MQETKIEKRISKQGDNHWFIVDRNGRKWLKEQRDWHPSRDEHTSIANRGGRKRWLKNRHHQKKDLIR